VHLEDADRFVAAAAERAGFTVGARVLECEGRTRLGRLAACGLLRASAPLAPILASRVVYRLERRARREEA
jgi:hypothetical protein